MVLGDATERALALTVLLDLPPLRAAAAERLRMTAIARAAALLPAHLAVDRAVDALDHHRDGFVRELGHWVRAARGDAPRSVEDAAAAHRAAALARAHGLGSVAESVLARAAAIERSHHELTAYRR